MDEALTKAILATRQVVAEALASGCATGTLVNNLHLIRLRKAAWSINFTLIVEVRLVAKEDLDERCAPVTAGGRRIAGANGRDSGARTCEGVSLVSGRIGSGGSRANWHTTVSKGATFEVHDAPIGWLRMIDGRYWDAAQLRRDPIPTFRDAALEEVRRMVEKHGFTAAELGL